MSDRMMVVRPEIGPKKELAPQFRRKPVDYYTKEPVGTIIIDTPNTYLYLVLGNGKALRYGVGVGCEGFTWSGAERVTKMAEWPDWTPPQEMIVRQPYLPRFMAGGEINPLGARALSWKNGVSHSRHQSKARSEMHACAVKEPKTWSLRHSAREFVGSSRKALLGCMRRGRNHIPRTICSPWQASQRWNG